MGLLRAHRVLYLFLGLYAVTLILLLPVKPLWMDEIIDLGGVRHASDVRGVLDFVPGNAGGVPLGYLLDFAMIKLFGYSVFVVRLPSVVFTLLTCAGVYILARQTTLRMPLLAVILYAVSPLTLRYALEARPYAQASCCSVFSTLIFLALVRRPTTGKAAAYAVLAAAGLFTQPQSIFVSVAHLLWLIFTRSAKHKARSLWLSGTALALASLSFLPWFLKIRAYWQGAVDLGARFVVTGKDLLVIPHELMGAGYIGAALTVTAIWMALQWSSWNKEEKIFWANYTVIPLLLVPAVDAYFGYFLAARQLIFVLVPISVLVAVCADTFSYPGARRWGLLVPISLLVAMVVEDVRWIWKPGDGWEAGSARLSRQMSEPGSCVLFAPGGARTMYVFFEPALPVCDETRLADFTTVAVAFSPDQSASAASDARQKLDGAGFRKVPDLRVTEPRIELYRR